MHRTVRLRRTVLCGPPRSGAPHEVGDESQRRKHQEYKEQDLRNADGAGSNAAKAEYRGNQSDDEEYDGVMQHDDLRYTRPPPAPCQRSSAPLQIAGDSLRMTS